ncbi:hypothetical protein EST92_18360 [Streptomyces sp. TM32]|uniref:DUF6415 family natural product biosynthesis protein n=1 Tax=Streptomyces sp. TM32 TaxID=1652669 RepID=UPI0010122391|nr:DUF6415 family natural product biosynthesis protein [Streptomyces sp. TM32]RXS79250.1 hypothetical protein EST92_18360 [Streptomyces sp. TM32]
MTATAGAPSRDEIQETVDRALVSGPPLPYSELVELEQALLLLIAGLWATVDESERRHPATPGYARRRARLDGIRHQTSVGLGDGLISAQVQVRALATDCQWLLSQCAAGARR